MVGHGLVYLGRVKLAPRGLLCKVRGLVLSLADGFAELIARHWWRHVRIETLDLRLDALLLRTRSGEIRARGG